MYDAMTQEEVEDWLEHIPVFAVTDSNGAGVVLKPDDDTSVFYFFLNPLAANATLTQLKSVNEEMDLKVSAFSLGKIWFKLLNGDADRDSRSHRRAGRGHCADRRRGPHSRYAPNGDQRDRRCHGDGDRGRIGESDSRSCWCRRVRSSKWRGPNIMIGRIIMGKMIEAKS